MLWLTVFTLALNDVVIAYLGRAWAIPYLGQPWIVIGVAAVAIFALNIIRLRALPIWTLAASVGLFASLAVGLFSIDIDRSRVSDVVGTLRMRDLATMGSAFIIGAMCIATQRSDGRTLANLMLASATLHALICVVALSRVAPQYFPVIDMVYYRDGVPVSRPEITTDQTRQVLYLFVCLCIVFVERSFIKFLMAIAVSLLIAYIVSKVQSRWSAVIFPAFATLAFVLSWSRNIQPLWRLLCVLLLGVVTAMAFFETIVGFLANLIWRFTQVDINLGGRAISISYLFQKLIDFEYWMPQGFEEFYQMYKSAPHSFPTMIYLNGGIVGLLSYLALVGLPIILLLRKQVSGNATGLETIALFCACFAFALLMTQPVISHEIFWLFAGMAVGALAKKPRRVETPKPVESSPRVAMRIAYGGID